MTTRTIGFVHIGALVAGIALALPAGGSDFPGYCTASADALRRGCHAQLAADRYVRKAICWNVSDPEEREECRADREEQRQEDEELCDEQHEARVKACRLLGEGRYDPDFEPELFDDPKNPSKPNPYFPLAVGNTWEYRGGDEVVSIQVLNETKRMESGVDCIVVEDLVRENGVLIEATDDWFAAAKAGDTWYCGEETKAFETFEGDQPMDPELVDVDGSFKAGRDGDKPGVIFLASPKVGDLYREEFSLTNAEDVSEVLSTTYKYGQDAELDELVPQALADRFCAAGDCVVTKAFALLEPDVFERKYWAKGIGMWLETNPEEGEVVQLTNCSFDSRCENLPQP